MGINHKSGSGSHAFADRGADCYETPPCAVRALLRVECLPPTIWEPACGPGSIARTLRAEGHRVWATDLHDYHSPDQDAAGLDFLAAAKLPDPNITTIVTNPPYRLAQQFVERATALCSRVIMLMRLAFLESERRTEILERNGLARVYIFRNRLPMMHRRGWDGPKASSSMPFAWFVWDAGYRGNTVIRRLSWLREDKDTAMTGVGQISLPLERCA